ncbi:hypothetical protein ELG67_09715 [Rhizobium leguminosarum]|uniref:hypothetical protein n=1 Tax=Rhizobium leguminosarum TaxID=384 RepID=UPI0010373674|nr:hypothetical protein [Rhizobium leguminosarum]TBG89345.1 hypothetical protein ELG67_09715 [Rhizobium leguminosarum]
MLANVPTVEENRGSLFERQTADDIIIKFAHSLLYDLRDWFHEFHFGCHADRVEWDDCDCDRLEMVGPEVIVGIDILEMSDGRFDSISPKGLHLLLFNGPKRRAIDRALKSALELERERVADLGNSDDYLPRIRKELMKARAAIFANCKVVGWQGNDA